MPERLCLDCFTPLGGRKTAQRCRVCANKAKAGNPVQREAARQAQHQRHYRERTVLDRAAELLPREWETIRAQFSPDELAVLTHIVKGTYWDTAAIPFLADEVDGAIRSEGLRRWPFNVEAFIGRLRVLSPAQAWAVVAALERHPFPDES